MSGMPPNLSLAEQEAEPHGRNTANPPGTAGLPATRQPAGTAATQQQHLANTAGDPVARYQSTVNA